MRCGSWAAPEEAARRQSAGEGLILKFPGEIRVLVRRHVLDSGIAARQGEKSRSSVFEIRKDRRQPDSARHSRNLHSLPGHLKTDGKQHGLRTVMTKELGGKATSHGLQKMAMLFGANLDCGLSFLLQNRNRPIFNAMLVHSKLAGKRALVTAGAQGIGLAISRQLLDAGCDVFVHYHGSAEAAGKLRREAEARDRRCQVSPADLTEPAECVRIVAEAAAFLGGLDVLINNAGSLVRREALADADDAYWAEVMALNLGSARRITRAAAPHLETAARTRGGASVVNLSSIAGRRGGSAGSLAYATAKGAILALTRGLALELGPKGIRVNALAPGFILGSQFHATHTTPEAARAAIAGIPLGRAGTTDDVARAAVYFASEFDGFMNGATLDLNGGSYMA